MIFSLTLAATTVVVGTVYATHWSWFVPGSNVEFLGIHANHVRIDVVNDGNIDDEVILGILAGQARIVEVVDGTTTASAKIEVRRVNPPNENAETAILSSGGAMVLVTADGNVDFILVN